MRVEILHIDECPNWMDAGTRVRAALDAVGLPGITVEYLLLTTREEAAHVAFAGSPTILIDGVDAFPSDGRTADLACRVYMTGQGLAGLPTTEQLEHVLRERYSS